MCQAKEGEPLQDCGMVGVLRRIGTLTFDRGHLRTADFLPGGRLGLSRGVVSNQDDLEKCWQVDLCRDCSLKILAMCQYHTEENSHAQVR